MNRKGVFIIILILSLVVAGTGIAMSSAIRAKNRAERELTIERANSEARTAETVRVEEEGRVTVLRLQLQHESDSIAQLALQENVSAALRTMNDSLQIAVRAISGISVEFQAVQRELKALVEMAVAETPQGDTVRIAAFVEEGPPVEGEMVVEVPIDPRASIMLTSVLRPSPWEATIQLGCTPEHAATFAFDAPDWVPAKVALGAVDAEVCNPMPNLSFAGELFRIDTSKLAWAGAGVSASDGSRRPSGDGGRGDTARGRSRTTADDCTSGPGVMTGLFIRRYVSPTIPANSAAPPTKSITLFIRVSFYRMVQCVARILPRWAVRMRSANMATEADNCRTAMGPKTGPADLR